MENLFYIYLFIFGLIFGSFGSVLIHRLYSSESGIISGRSHCTNCGHTLGVLDLFPVLSYMFLFGKCRYCNSKIPLIYPFLELVMGLAFLSIGYFAIDFTLLLSADKIQLFRLIFFLSAMFILVILSFYDLLYQLIPIEMLGSSVFILFMMHIISIIYPENLTFFGYFKLDNYIGRFTYFKDALFGSFVIYTFFYLQIFLPGIYYAIEKKKYKLVKLEAIEYFILPIWMVIGVFSKYKSKDESEYEEFEDAYTFMGHGDLWIAIFMGLFLGLKMSLLGLALAYIFGSIFGMYILFIKRQRNTRLAFGPFLSLGTFVSLLFFDKIVYMFFNLFKVY